MSETLRDRILAVLTERTEGLPTPRIAELAGEDMRDRRRRVLSKYGDKLREMERRGEVTRCHSLVPAREVSWRLVPARERRLYRARYEATVAWNALTPDDRATLGITAAQWQEFMDRHRPTAMRAVSVREKNDTDGA